MPPPRKKKINTEDALVQLLEARLDNVVYRLGFGKSRPHARQLVSHRHITVNGKKINIPSYSVKEEDVISLQEKMQSLDLKARITENPELPAFLERQNLMGKLKKLPTKEDISNPVNYQLVIEFYSR